MNYAPIIIFAFNRSASLEKLIISLKNNPEAKDSILHIFVDGPRNIAGEQEKIRETQKIAKNITGFKSVEYHFSDINNGLGSSVITGVTKVITQYGKAIVLEDDLILASNFLAFMNEGLTIYEKEQKIFSICGYTNRIKKPKNYGYDAYLCTRSSSWGWGTWKDRWETVNWELNDWESCLKNKKTFNKWGGSDCFRMLSDWKSGKNKSWAIRFCYSQFTQSKLALFPIISKVKNDGFDGEGTNCKKYSRFKCDYENTRKVIFKFPDDLEMQSILYKSAMAYHSIIIRIWSKLMYIIYN